MLNVETSDSKKSTVSVSNSPNLQKIGFWIPGEFDHYLKDSKITINFCVFCKICIIIKVFLLHIQNIKYINTLKTSRFSIPHNL